VAAKNIVFAKFANAGQTCIAPDYLLVDKRVKEKLVELIVCEIQRAYGKTVEAQSGTEGLAHLVNARHFARVKALLDDAVGKGARVLEGGGSAAPGGASRGALISPPQSARQNDCFYYWRVTSSPRRLFQRPPAPLQPFTRRKRGRVRSAAPHRAATFVHL
jgi:hypothetical protein